jgi:hypothetical protein
MASLLSVTGTRSAASGVVRAVSSEILMLAIYRSRSALSLVDEECECLIGHFNAEDGDHGWVGLRVFVIRFI